MSLSMIKTHRFLNHFHLNTLPHYLKLTLNYCVRSRFSEQEQLISNAVVSNQSLSIENWAQLKEQVFNIKSHRNQVTEYNFDGKVINHCLCNNSLESAKSYIDFLNHHQKKINLAVITKFLLLCSKSPEPVDENLILSFYDKVKDLEVLDATSCEYIIAGLSKTHKWREGFVYLDQMQEACLPSRPAYALLIQAAFDNNDPETAWRMLEKMFQDIRFNKSIPQSIVESCLNYAHSHNSRDTIIKMFHFLSLNGLYISKNLADSIKYWMHKENINTNFCTILKGGECTNCSQKLNPLFVDKEQFLKMKTYFFNNILIGKNIYLKSSPEEFQNFKSFIEKTSPYDVVLDGLNIAYSHIREKNPNIMAQNIVSVVNHFYSQNKKILILGRKHMLNWRPMYQIKNKSRLFVTDNLSQDDPYLLYATLHSGLGTNLISLDLMRNHAFKYINEPELMRTFRQWQCKYQLNFQFYKDKSVKIMPPLPYIPIAQACSNNYWHLPIEDEGLNKERSNILSSPDNWLCIKFPK